MDVELFPCSVCGKVICNRSEYVWCDCGRRWCSYDCAGADDCINHDFGEGVEDGNEPTGTTCAFCRKEDASDGELLDFLLDKCNLSREEVAKEYFEWLEEQGDDDLSYAE